MPEGRLSAVSTCVLGKIVFGICRNEESCVLWVGQSRSALDNKGLRTEAHNNLWIRGRSTRIWSLPGSVGRYKGKSCRVIWVKIAGVKAWDARLGKVHWNGENASK